MVVLGLRRFAPVVPGSLVAVAIGVVAVELASPDGVEIVGTIDSGLPPVGLPDAPASDYLNLAASAVGLALVGFAEGLGAAKTYAARHNYDIDANRELMGLGAGNLGAGLASGMVVNGGLSKTAVNGGAGAHSQISGLVVAVLTVVTLLFLTGLFESLPEATLAAVVIAAVIELVDVHALVRLYRVWTSRLGKIYGPAARADFVAALAALFGVLIFDTLPGLFIGIGVSLGLPLYRASRPNVAVLGRTPHGRWVDLVREDDAEPQPGVAVLRVEAGCSSPTPTMCATRSARTRARTGEGGRARRRDRPRHRRHDRGDALPVARRSRPRRGPAARRARHRPGARRPAPRGRRG